MRILYVNNINEVAEIDANELAMRGHTVAVYDPSLRGGLAPLPVKLALMPERIFGLRQVVGSLNPNQYDIVHIHWASYGVLGLASQVPFVVECHGSDVRDRLKHPFFRSILTPIFRRAAAVLCITPDLLPVVQSVRQDAIFSPGSIDTDQFSPGQDKQPNSSRQWNILLFTRLDPIKAPEVALQGIAQFTERHTDVRVRILDWGLLKDKYKRCYGERFEFISFVAERDVQHLIRSSDVVLGQFKLGILSFCELQAMSCAKPVIASFLYDEAYPTPPPLCKATSPEEVDDQLENLFHHPDVAIELGQKARNWVIKYHSRQALAVKLEILYQLILSGQ